LQDQTKNIADKGQHNNRSICQTMCKH